MVVTFNGTESTTKNLPGGGPQGCSFGILEYLSQTCQNLNFVSPDMRYKYIDDASVLEHVNLKHTTITTYNIIGHVPSDIPVHNQFIPAEQLNSQYTLIK